MGYTKRELVEFFDSLWQAVTSNVFREDSSEVMVFEAAIDAMCYMAISRDYGSSLVALGMLWDAPLATFLSEHPQIQGITFCLDNDAPRTEGIGFTHGEILRAGI